MKIENAIVWVWEKYGGDILILGQRLVAVALILVAGKITIRLSRRLGNRKATGKIKPDQTLSSVLKTIIHYGVIIVCLIMILDTFGVSTTSLIALLGAAGVAVGFALKDTLSNIAAGIVILFIRPFQQGDFIECASVMGTVREVGLFASNLETADGVFISVPNSSLWGVPLKNYSRNLKRRMDITISISYSDSIESAFRVVQDIIGEEPRFLKEPAPQVMVQSLGDSGVGITLRAWVSGSVYWSTYWDQMKNLKEKIQEAGLIIAFPQRTIHLADNSLARFRDLPDNS